MKFVEPIRQKGKIKEIRELLKHRKQIRELLLFSLGINAALRISDLLNIKVKDVFTEDGEIKDSFDRIESKTSKRSRVTISPKLKTDIEIYKEAYPKIISNPENYLFFNSRSMPFGASSISRKHAWSIITKTCLAVGLTGRFGGHTLRKTWGYQAKQKGVELYLIQKKLNHSNTGVTLRYLGITDDDLEAVANELDL